MGAKNAKTRSEAGFWDWKSSLPADWTCQSILSRGRLESWDMDPDRVQASQEISEYEAPLDKQLVALHTKFHGELLYRTVRPVPAPNEPSPMFWRGKHDLIGENIDIGSERSQIALEKKRPLGIGKSRALPYRPTLHMPVCWRQARVERVLPGDATNDLRSGRRWTR